jgi:hypothetical protein
MWCVPRGRREGIPGARRQRPAQVRAKAAGRLAQADVLERYPASLSPEVLPEAVHIADARARAAVDANDPEAPELQARAADLARTAVDRFGATFEARVTKEQVRMMAAAVTSGMDAVSMPEAERRVFLAAMLERLRVVEP